jgi:hypothetical protein
MVKQQRFSNVRGRERGECDICGEGTNLVELMKEYFDKCLTGSELQKIHV